jgi:hypothetical protein
MRNDHTLICQDTLGTKSIQGELILEVALCTGLHAATGRITQPAIGTLQPAGGSPISEGEELIIARNGGLILVIN